ncbi:hypothetical protein TC41_1466 [Alicyclobacillus acidocaldarius subsp. acidocaldarius Tc-4-1]|uniref:Uncharacterized protein n=1 Tax=Alicyclobacillus acidocaldarius (strain Tc-4-1) TaxID=1048834 RepID=F8IJ80_ALIAT|nr:hypothetical protein TC41_1466 [Alicyclobacillus acidocaldarius subsp. acidocaldarius Tc-4-1]
MSSCIAASTFCLVEGFTYPELFTTRDTVMMDTPARFATSAIVAMLVTLLSRIFLM